MSERGKKFKALILGTLGALLLKLVHASLRWHYAGVCAKDAALGDDPPVIMALWHGRQLMLPWIYKRLRGKKTTRHIYVLISEHGDGRTIATAVRFVGLRNVGGSSTRGGRKAALSLLHKVEEGCDVGVTPDGPKGPKYQAKPGTVRMAQLSGAPIYPVACSAERRWTFRSWDEMILPKPFSRAVYNVGEPIYVPKDATEEELLRYDAELTARLIKATEEADNYSYA